MPHFLKKPASTCAFSYLVLLLGISVYTIWASRCFPGGYSPLHHHISNLGGSRNCALGAAIWNWGTAIFGVLFIFFLWYISKRSIILNIIVESEHLGEKRNGLQRAVAMTYKILLLVIGPAFIGVGLFSEDTGAPHVACASIALVGCVIMINAELVGFFLQKAPLKQKTRKISSTISLIALDFTLIYALIVPKWYNSVARLNDDPIFFRFQPWEWLLYLQILANIFIMIKHLERK